MAKKKTSIRLSLDGKTLLEKIAKHLSISQADVMELAIRKLAKQEGIKSDDRLDTRG